jgi:hypothetical protein
MKITTKTNSKALQVFAYIGKIIATIFGVAFGVFYLIPAIEVSTNLPVSIISIMILGCMVVFEMILHFGLASFVQGLMAKEFRLTDFIGIILCFVVVLWVSLHSTEKAFLITAKGLTDLDSLQKKHTQEQNTLTQKYEKQLVILQNNSSPALEKLQAQNQWAYLTALKIYESSRNSILSEKNEAIGKLEKVQKYNFAQAELKNKNLINIHNQRQAQDTQNAKYFGLYALIFSLYSTIVIGTYRNKNLVQSSTMDLQNEVSQVSPQVQNTEVQCAKVSSQVHDTTIMSITAEPEPQPAVQNTHETVQQMQGQTTHVNVTIMPTPSVPIITPAETLPTIKKDKKVSDAVAHAKVFMEQNNFIKNLTTSDKEKCLTVMEMFGISRGTYYRIKQEIQ